MSFCFLGYRCAGEFASNNFPSNQLLAYVLATLELMSVRKTEILIHKLSGIAAHSPFARTTPETAYSMLNYNDEI